ncbi:MAG: extracellular solute-binding protein [Granulosicoccus sp.]
MTISRRHFVSSLAASALLPDLFYTRVHAAATKPWHEDIARQAGLLNQQRMLHVLIPNGSGSNVKAATDEFTRLSGVECKIQETAVDKINVELILGTRSNAVDVALPATFGLIDLVQANVILPLDTYAEKYEPPGFSEDYLYRKGDYYHGKLYGYQTDGDAYLMFYNKSMMEDPAEIKAYAKATGKVLQPASSWEDLDSMMAFFHRPGQNQYGGNLFRNPGYLVWEWWARFHAKGYLPFDKDMRANINNAAGVEALEELTAASRSLTPNSESNSLFDNWEEFAAGNVFCNIGWGGTQKYLMSKANMRDNLIHSPLPGPLINGSPSTMGYFNWGWNYTVGASSSQPELAYLLALFCACPQISTKAVRAADGYFDPYRKSHYLDETIRQVYGDSFLAAHEKSLNNSVPDLYISGQSNYLDVLRQQILATIHGELSAQEALNIGAQKWSHITRRLGTRTQRREWKAILDSYPTELRHNLLDQ